VVDKLTKNVDITVQHENTQVTDMLSKQSRETFSMLFIRILIS